MKHLTHEQLENYIDTYGANLDAWPSKIDASTKDRILHSDSLQAYCEDTMQTDLALQTLLQPAINNDESIRQLARQIQHKARSQSPFTTHWYKKLFTGLPSRVAFASVLLATLILSSVMLNHNDEKPDMIFAQWAWEEVLDETAEVDSSALYEEYSFMLSEG
jgi:hypothetical protein